MDHILNANLAKYIHEERLRQAEAERRCRQLLAEQPQWYVRIRHNLGDRLIGIGPQVKNQTQSERVELKWEKGCIGG
jgi:hypothetical protein